MSLAPLFRLGALATWREEIRTGKRQNTAADFDDLHSAAAWEKSALLLAAAGDHEGAQKQMDVALVHLCGRNPAGAVPTLYGLREMARAGRLSVLACDADLVMNYLAARFKVRRTRAGPEEGESAGQDRQGWLARNAKRAADYTL